VRCLLFQFTKYKVVQIDCGAHTQKHKPEAH
jgi:hypothetical protein